VTDCASTGGCLIWGLPGPHSRSGDDAKTKTLSRIVPLRCICVFDSCVAPTEGSVNNRFWRFAELMLGLVLFSSPSMAQTHQQKPDTCRDKSHMTQGGLNECAVKELHNAELKLERLLNQLGIRRDSPEQKAWEAYRDAQLAALYPQETTSSYGSVYPMCLAILKRTLTEGRIRDLKALTTSGEGDVCYGYRASGSKND